MATRTLRGHRYDTVMNISRVLAFVTRNVIWWPAMAIVVFLAVVVQLGILMGPMFYVLLFAKGAAPGASQRVILGAETVHPLMVLFAGVTCFVAVFVIYLLVPSSGDNAWLAVVVPGSWLVVTGLVLMGAAGTNGTRGWRPLIGGIALAAAVTGGLTVLAMAVFSITVDATDLEGEPLRSRLIVISVLSAMVYLGVMTALASGRWRHRRGGRTVHRKRIA